MIKGNILRINEQIRAICAKNGRNPKDIVIIAVTKGRSLGQITEAIESGLVDIGENKVKEASEKYAVLSAKQINGKRIKWHMIGHLQTNKVKEAVKIFDLIHSVDSVRLAKEIDKEAAKINKIQDILIQVNTSGEVSKFGLKFEDVSVVTEEVSRLKNVSIKGLMTIGPLVEDIEQARVCFRMLKELRDKLNSLQLATCGLQLLSMGMSNDFEAALEEGSDMVRLGRVIFEGLK